MIEIQNPAVAHLSVLTAAPEVFARLAAAAGYGEIGLRIQSAGPGTPHYPQTAGSAGLAALRTLLADLGLRVGDVEMVTIGPDLDVPGLRPMFEAAAELGADRLNCAGDDPDPSRIVERFAAIAAMAAEHGMTVDLEFMRWRPIGTFADAARVVRASGAANAGVLVDALHLFRSGGSVATVAADAALVRTLQICDAPLAHPADGDYLAEARNHRLAPGDGHLPLVALLGVLNPTTRVSIEVPCPESSRSDPLAHLMPIRQKTETILRAAASGSAGVAGA